MKKQDERAVEIEGVGGKGCNIFRQVKSIDESMLNSFFISL